MKVICIKEGAWVANDPSASGSKPSYGDICTVLKEDVYKTGWVLKEHRYTDDGQNHSFLKKWFVPLSSIDETKMERNYKTEKVCTKLSK